MMTDVRFALRQLFKSPGFTLLALITLALGIGLNTAIFSLVNDLFLRGLPFQEPERVVHMFANRNEANLKEIAISAPRFMHYRDGQTIFAGFAAESATGFTLTGVGDPVQLNGSRVTPNYFDVLGARPIKGRNFLPNEEEGADVALVTENFWRKRLGGDENVIGRSITLDGVPHTIVGVLPNQPAAWFGAQPPAEVFATKPFLLPGFSHERIMRGTGFLRVIARLKPGQTIEQTRAALPSLDHSYESQYPDKIDSHGFTTIKNIPEDVNGNLRPAFTTLLAAVGFVLLIACSNVANLLLVRFSGRRREIALRIAIGASRASVVRLFIFESLLVSVLAGIVGALVAWQLVPLVPKITANFLPLEPTYNGPGLSLPVLSFTIALSILTGLVMGLYPAWQSSRADLVDGLKEGGRGTSGSLRQQRFRKILVGAQVALSVTLLAGAALLVTSFIKLSKQNMGFRADHLWTGFITLPQAQYPDQAARARFVDKTLGALKTVSSFERASISSDIPLNGGSRVLYTRPEGDVPPIDKRPACPAHEISPGYFGTWGISLLSGREIDDHDVASRQNVIVISQAGARKLFGSENPIGHTLLITGGSVPVEIVGVAADVRSQRLNEANDMEFYRPYAQENFPFLSIAVRSNMKPEAVTRLVQSALNGIDPAIAIALPQAMDEVVTQALGQARLMMILLGIFAGVALLLATVGIYGAVAYTVEQRTGEIGVRMALGAQTRDILRLIIRQGMKPVVFGLAIGVGAALAVGRLIASQLYQTSAYNPFLLSATLSILGIAALLACLFPAYRATLVNPVDALRTE
jgi:putative ABC transport system permease protein